MRYLDSLVKIKDINTNEGEIVEYGNPQAICRKYNYQKKFKESLFINNQSRYTRNYQCAKNK